GLFTVAEGANTFYLLGFEYTGDLSAYDVQLTLIFLPSSYGTVDPTLAGGADVPDDEAPSRVITAADADRERLASIEADNERMRREMEEMRAEFERLRAEVSDNRQ
ncbi:MAG: hypothetical protein PHQ19_10430, partial [Candidatus Krumholzibacteria bacterium]|nr:hypothetical protein [Candidatus Krumholzibacteria bacterium]